MLCLGALPLQSIQLGICHACRRRLELDFGGISFVWQEIGSRLGLTKRGWCSAGTLKFSTIMKAL
jgi:hypothetical protein